MDDRRELANVMASKFRVVQLSDIDHLLAAAREHQPVAVVLGDGIIRSLELYSHFQKQYRNAPLIAVSISNDHNWLSEMVKIGIDDFLPWPISPADLEIRLQNATKHFSNRHDMEWSLKMLREDLSEIKEFEANLVQTEKLSQLGEMIAGIVHEINNPLNYSHTGLYVLREMIKTLDDELRTEFSEVLADITEGLDRVNHIVRDLRNFATRSRTHHSDVDLAAAVQTSARLLGHKLSSINVILDIPENLIVFGNENKYCQVIVNLIKNGVEATEDAGRSLENSQIRVSAQERAEGIELRIRDNGCGIPEDLLPNIFTPFYSTKQTGKGMGLGLSICRKIMEEFGGTITAESKHGCHSEFILTFPRTQLCAAASPDRNLSNSKPKEITT